MVELCCEARLSLLVSEVREGLEVGGEGKEGDCGLAGEAGGEEDVCRAGGGGGGTELPDPAAWARFSLFGLA